MVRMLAKINIIVANVFLLFINDNIKKRFCVSSMFDYHVRLHCVCAPGGLMVVSFSKKHCGFLLNSFVSFCKRITVFKISHQSHDRPGVYCSLSKLWVPIIFDTGSVELGCQLFWSEVRKEMLWRSGARGMVRRITSICNISFPLLCCCTL